MSDISVYKLNKFYGATHVLKDISFDVYEGQKSALIGNNGAGKTTLFKILCGDLDYDSGSVNICRDKKVAVLDQIPVFDENSTVSDVLDTAFCKIFDLQKKKVHLERSMDSGDKDILHEYSKVLEKLEHLGEYDIDYRKSKVCNGLHIDNSQLHMKFNSLSGGEKTRINLARMILCDTDILLLDEPTNHLDLSSINWLCDFVSSYKGSIIAISHDRYFLDKCFDEIIEIEDGVCDFYHGSYSYYAIEKPIRVAQKLEEHLRSKNEIKRLEEKSRKMHQWGTERMHKRATSIDKRINRIRVTDRPKISKDINVKFGDSEFFTEDIIKVRDLSKSYQNKVLFSNLNFTIKNGDRFALIGDNGCGKTTLLNILLKKIDKDSGKIYYADGLKIGYLPQEVKFSHDYRNLIDTMIYEKNVTAQTARNRLGAFRFSGEDVFKTVKDLSGGEKSRLRLCTLMYDKINLLILDEPTNHLDISSREWIEEALESFCGTLLFVSHDGYFISRFASRILCISDSGVIDFKGTYDKFLELHTKVDNNTGPAVKFRENRPYQNNNKKSAQKLYKKELSCVEKQISDVERQISEIDTEICQHSTDHLKLSELLEKKKGLSDTLDCALKKWEELSLIICD